jgi:hypothetical protein
MPLFPSGPSLLNKSMGWFNVKAYGVKGDGVTNDSAAILLAIAAAGAVGGVVYFPQGTYVSNDIFLVYSNISIVGAGMPQINAGRTALVGGTILKCKVSANNQTGITVRDMGLDVSAVLAANGLDSGSNATGDQFITVENVIVLASAGAHGCLLTSGDFNTVRNLRVYKASHGLAFRCSSSIAVGVYAEDCDTSAVVIKGASGQNAHDNNVSGVVNVGTSAYSAGAVLLMAADNGMSCYNNVVSNLVSRNGKYGVLFQGLNSTSVYDNLVSGVNIESSQFHGIWFELGDIRTNTVVGVQVSATSSATYFAVNNSVAANNTNRVLDAWTPIASEYAGAFAKVEVNNSSELNRNITAIMTTMNNGSLIVYRMRDEFTTARAAGTINNTLPEPGPGGPRGVLDTNNKLSITGGNLSFATGGLASFDPSFLNLEGNPRVAGRMVFAQVNYSVGRIMVGWLNDKTLTASAINLARRGMIDLNGAGSGTAPAAAGTVVNFTTAFSTNYIVCVAVRASGNQYFIKGGAFTNWTLIYIDSTGTDATLYPFISALGTTAVGTSSYLHVAQGPYLAPPIISDGFGSAFGSTDGLGHTEGVNDSVGRGGAGVAWTQQVGTWANTGGSSSAATLVGGIAIATAPGVTADVIARIKITRSAGAGGLVLRYTDSSNYLYVNHDGTNVFLKQVLAGVTTTLITGVATYVANAMALVDLSGVNARLYYNSVFINSSAGINAALTATAHGVYVNDTTVQLDDFSLYAKGTSTEYVALDAF